MLNLNSLLPGFYEPFRHTLNRAVGLQPSDQMPVTSVISGAASGAVGGMFCSLNCYILDAKSPQAILGNPLFMIKARIQACSKFTASAYANPGIRHIRRRCPLVHNITTRIRSMLCGQYLVNKVGEVWCVA